MRDVVEQTPTLPLVQPHQQHPQQQQQVRTQAINHMPSSLPPTCVPLLSLLTYLTHRLLLLLCTLTSALVHRRHLMVWRVFAPKTIFECVLFFAATLCYICLYGVNMLTGTAAAATTTTTTSRYRKQRCNITHSLTIHSLRRRELQQSSP